MGAVLQKMEKSAITSRKYIHTLDFSQLFGFCFHQHCHIAVIDSYFLTLCLQKKQMFIGGTYLSYSYGYVDLYLIALHVL